MTSEEEAMVKRDQEVLERFWYEFRNTEDYKLVLLSLATGVAIEQALKIVWTDGGEAAMKLARLVYQEKQR